MICFRLQHANVNGSPIVLENLGVVLDQKAAVVVENNARIKMVIDLNSQFQLPDEDLNKFHTACLPKVDFQNKKNILNV